ncbi:hypothetical protein BV898_11382 [Hypsibius exemplaris]|uniref:Uncharacterized protein n=1 Tax=Hypsibius exemplaris TaxID=2072580 RepID=A0A1W0WGS7_HYPEX|nr:hypothetical protein BV898_11382 [Hypsibius exemplaris]
MAPTSACLVAIVVGLLAVTFSAQAQGPTGVTSTPSTQSVAILQNVSQAVRETLMASQAPAMIMTNVQPPPPQAIPASPPPAVAVFPAVIIAHPVAAPAVSPQPSAVSQAGSDSVVTVATLPLLSPMATPGAAAVQLPVGALAPVPPPVQSMTGQLSVSGAPDQTVAAVNGTSGVAPAKPMGNSTRTGRADLDVSTPPTQPTPAPLSIAGCNPPEILQAAFNCLLYQCPTLNHRKLICTNANTQNIRGAFALFNNTNPNQYPNTTKILPIYVQLNGGAVNLTSDLFSLIANQIGKLELNQVNLGAGGLPDNVFASLDVMTVLELDGVLLDKISAGSFRGMDKLQSLTLNNLTTLEALQNGTFDAVMAAGSPLRCLNINVSSPRFTCTCAGSMWIKPSLANADKINANSANWTDMYGVSSPLKGKCDVNLVCNGNSSAPLLGKDITDRNTTCPAPPPPTPAPTVVVTNATVAATPAATPKKPDTGAAGMTVASATLLLASVTLTHFLHY